MVIIGGDNEFNYNIGMLIILLLFFWFVCKCVGKSNYQSHYIEPMEAKNKTIYADSPLVIGGGLPYIHTIDDVIHVPDSNLSMHNLKDTGSYKCGSLERAEEMDKKQTEMHLAKRPLEGFRGPRSKTDSHELMCGSDHTKDLIY